MAIKVYVEYGLVVKCSGQEYYQYKDFLVEGHADNLGGVSGVKCCAGVTAVLLGLQRLLDTQGNYKYEFRNGYFRLTQYGDEWTNKELNTYLNLVLCQLYDIKLIYPDFFSSFETKRLFIKKGKKKEWLIQ